MLISEKRYLLMSNDNRPLSVEPPSSVRTIANLGYALHALAILIGNAGAATVIGSFVGSLPSIVAVIMNYATRSDARGSWKKRGSVTNDNHTRLSERHSGMLNANFSKTVSFYVR